MKINWYKVRHYASNALFLVPRLVVAPIVVPVLFYLSPLLSLLVGLFLLCLTGRWQVHEPTFFELTKLWIWPAF